MKANYTRILSNVAISLIVLLSGCQAITRSPASCRARAPGNAAPFDMCSAQNFTDFRGVTGKIEFDQAIPVKRLLRLGKENTGTQAAILLHNRWPDGTELRVAFLNDPYGLKNEVLSIANEWHSRAHANISFVESNAANSNIRVTFTGSGYWSLIGTQASGQPGRPTLCLGFPSAPSTTQLHRTVLHEFGHSIGLIHEHQQPVSSIHWDAQACYQYYEGPPNCWTKQMVDSNVLQHYSENPAIFHTGFDEESIMEYPVDPRLTTDHKGIPWNNDLSAMDRQFIATVYP
jgi:serralysin